MKYEGQRLDYKSLRAVVEKNSKLSDIAVDCVAFANADGGKLIIGVEDGQTRPPREQRIDKELLATLPSKLHEHMINVPLTAHLQHDEALNADVIELDIRRSHNIASTRNGRYYIRIGDSSRPLCGDEVVQLMDERSARPWETLLTSVSCNDADQTLVADLGKSLRNSDRVKPFVKDKTDIELLEHYFLASKGFLTNIGVLFVGMPFHRAALGSSPSIQFIKYDAEENKIHKICWDDHSLSPIQLIENVWKEIPDFQESYELPEGLVRRHIPAFDSRVVRELLVNALVHRPYTQTGDLYLRLYPDRLEISNPGRLPIGVTPQNILHQARHRNAAFAKLFHDMHLMEREGSGFDLIYEVLTSHGRALPRVVEQYGCVIVDVQRRILAPEVIDLLTNIDMSLHLRQRERILLGILAQHESLSARELCDILALNTVDELQSWLGKLPKYDVIKQSGKTSGTRYYVDPETLRKCNLAKQTTLRRIEPYRLMELLAEDLRRHPRSSFGEIHKRVGTEISPQHVRTQLQLLIQQNRVLFFGKNRWRRYVLA